MKSFGELRENLDKNKMKKMGIDNPLAGFPYNEKTMTQSQIDKREKIVMDLKKNMSDFKKRYGKDAKDVMYATATKMAMADSYISDLNLDSLMEDGHTDVASVKNQIHIAMDALQKMSSEIDKLSPEDSLPTWWTNKVAIAVDKLDGMADYIDAKMDTSEAMSPFTPPTTKFGLGLPPTSKMKKQMDFILKRDKSFRNRMNKLVIGRETDKDGRITLYFKSARSRQKFRDMLNYGMPKMSKSEYHHVKGDKLPQVENYMSSTIPNFPPLGSALEKADIKGLLAKHKAGKNIGSTNLARLKARGLVARTSGKHAGKKVDLGNRGKTESMEEQKSTHKSPYSGERSGTGIDKPLIRWMDAFEKALKRAGSSYSKVDPVDALKLYYKGIDPKRAASQLKESVQLDEATQHTVHVKVSRQSFRKLESMIASLDGYKESDYSDGKARFYFDAKKHDSAERKKVAEFIKKTRGAEFSHAVKEDVKLEEKKDPRLSIVSRKISKLKDKERDLLASAINMSGGAAGAPMANRANLDRFNDGVIIPAMTFLRKNMSSLTPEGKKLSKKILSVLGESVELDEVKATARNIVKGLTDADGPFTVVAIKGNKVIKQETTKRRDMLPAMISTMRKEVGSGVTIGIEDKRGTIRNTFKEDIEIQEKLEFKFPNREIGLKFMRELMAKGLGNSIGERDGSVRTMTHSGRTGEPTMSHKEIAKIMKKYKGKFVKTDEGPRIAKIFEDVQLDEGAAEAKELFLFADNTQALQNQQMSIIKNLMSKRAQGKYDSRLAAKLFMYLVDNAAKMYVKEFDAPGTKYHKVFDKPTRMMAARLMTDQFESEADVGAYDEFIPKKYRKNEDMNYLPPDILKKRMKQVKKKTFSKFKEDIANTASGGNIAGLGSPPDDFPPVSGAAGKRYKSNNAGVTGERRLKAKTVLPEENVEEGFASDAQRRAAFASGYKAKGKKGKKEEGLRQDLRDLKKKNEGLRQAMSGPKETPAQKRKRREKDNFDLYKKRLKRVSALRGDPSSRKLTRGQEKHYQQTVNLKGIRGEGINEQPEHEIRVGNYTTKFFYMCGSAQKVMKKHADKPGAEELTRMQDDFYKLEKAVMDAGSATDEQKSKATTLYNSIMKKAKEVGIEKEVGKYMKMHIDSVIKGNPKLGFGRTDVSESIQEESFAGCRVFEVSSDNYVKALSGRTKYERWHNKFDVQDDVVMNMKKYVTRNPEKPVIIKNKITGEMSYLTVRPRKK